MNHLHKVREYCGNLSVIVTSMDDILMAFFLRENKEIYRVNLKQEILDEKDKNWLNSLEPTIAVIFSNLLISASEVSRQDRLNLLLNKKA